MNTSFNLKRTYHSFERKKCTFSSFATLMYFFSPTDQQSNNLGRPVSTIFFSTFHPLHFFLNDPISQISTTNQLAVSYWRMESRNHSKGELWIFSPGPLVRRRSLKLILTLTGGSGVTFFYMIQHPCFLSWNRPQKMFINGTRYKSRVSSKVNEHNHIPAKTWIVHMKQ